ncbi:MAG: hypothetical protein AAGC63_08815 [Propionicimonas sp.]|nr:hypothetical protein [Propionicimonas sp.]
MTSPSQSSPRDRIVATALAEITAKGLSVGLDHISLEKVIAASGVSRATAYRIWSNKQQFLADVIVEAVRTTTLEVDTELEVGRLRALLERTPDFATNPASRRHVVVDGLRISIRADLDRIVTSPKWATYLALSATCRGLPDGILRTEVTAALAEADRRFTAHRVSVYARIPRLLGYRLVPPLEERNGFELLSQAAGALMTGFVVKAGTQPELLTTGFRLAAFEAGELEWTVPSFALTGLVLSYLEPDPGIPWGPEQTERFRATLAEIAGVLETAWGEQDGPA